MWTRGLDTRYLLFTGKGGVGKTSLACAAAVELARSGKNTLIVSTDPASNLDEVLEQQLGTLPTRINEVANLWAANLDPDTAAAAYREKVVAPFRGKLPPAVIRTMEEQFSGACTTEIASFDEFVRLMADPRATERFDNIVFDTAPTGHTLRLLSLPGAWNGYLNTTTAEASCLGPLAGLQEQKRLYEVAFKSLSDPEMTTVVLVARPEKASLKEAARTQFELGELGIRNLHLIVNSVYRPDTTEDPVALAFSAAVKAGLASMPESLQALPIHQVPMLGGNVVGLEALNQLLLPAPTATSPLSVVHSVEGASMDKFVDGLALSGHGVIMTMGKGGVGKTTVAIDIARRLAAKGNRVILTTTDPAGNVMDLVEESEPNLQVERIDPAAELSLYRASVLRKGGESMDEAGLALLAEDLRSPCTEEIAVFRAFAETVSKGEDAIVVIDTAPTGHTILLMDATESYHREVSRTQSDAPEAVKQLLPRLRNPAFTKVVLVTLPEPTPVHEAMQLQSDLSRAGITPYGWVVNRSLAYASPKEPILAGKAAKEAGPVREVLDLGMPFVVLPWTVTGMDAPAMNRWKFECEPREGLSRLGDRFG